MMFCPYFRYRISCAADAGVALGGMTKRHVRRCPTCRRFYNACHAMDQALRRDADAFAEASSAPAINRILAAVDRPGGRFPVRALLWRVLAAVACLTVVAAFALIALRDGRGQSRPTYDRMVEELRGIYSAQPYRAADLSPAEAPAEVSALIAGPMATEMQNLTEDTKLAVRFVVACLHVNLAEPLAAETVP